MAKNDIAEKKAQDGRKILELKEPFEFKGEIYTELPYRAATGRDIRKGLNIPKTGDRYMALAVDLFEMPEAFFVAMPGNEFMAVTDVIDGFFKSSRTD